VEKCLARCTGLGTVDLAIPPFELWFMAWFALVPLLWAIEREGSVRRSFILGWLFGNIFFLGTCWWLTFAPITYAGFPAPLAYLLLFCVTSVAAIFPGIFAAFTSFLLNRYGSLAFLAVPFFWVFTEFARYWITGNNWNAVGYSQAFGYGSLKLAGIGGVLLISFLCVGLNSALTYSLSSDLRMRWVWGIGSILLIATVSFLPEIYGLRVALNDPSGVGHQSGATVIAIQPNVPMSGLNTSKWDELRNRQIERAQAEVTRMRRWPMVVILPESPMNFMYNDDREFQQIIGDFATRNNVSVLFNSAEPDASNGKYFNSAVLVGPDGKEAAQYDKIYLLPFGEAVPFPLGIVMPAFVGSFSYGKEYDLLPLGEAKAGVMICFESHFGQLSREYVRNGADVIIEMTNDGYLGPTPVLRQHLAKAVFRAVETNRPVLRVTNVGITAYINERGEVLDAAESYVEDTRVWSVAKSDGSQTFYVKYGDWFAWLCSILTMALLVFSLVRRRAT
jgi:apolipoprotein N-acyltransferase